MTAPEGVGRIWTPKARIIDLRDAERRHRRLRRHGQPRSRSVPMPAAVRSIDDARALRIEGTGLRSAWGAWIDGAAAWVWFTTHTFKEDVFPDRALRLYDRWSARLAEAIREKSRCSPELHTACAVEWTCRGRVHLHAVVSGRGLSEGSSCGARSKVTSMPLRLSLGRLAGSTGTRCAVRRRGKPTELTVDDVRALLNRLPEWSDSPRVPRFPVRAIRRGFRNGAAARNTRCPERPRTLHARCGDTEDHERDRQGALWPRGPLIRHVRLTQLAETGNLPGTAFIADHRRASTTDGYVRANQRAAERALASAGPLGVMAPTPNPITSPNRLAAVPNPAVLLSLCEGEDLPSGVVDPLPLPASPHPGRPRYREAPSPNARVPLGENDVPRRERVRRRGLEPPWE